MFCVSLATAACLAVMASPCRAAPFVLLLRNETGATLIPYRVAADAQGRYVRVADPSGAVAPGAEVQIATAGFDPVFFDPVSRRALLLDSRSRGTPGVLAAVFQYEISPATDGLLSPVRTELSRTAFAMSPPRLHVLVLADDWSVYEGVRTAPVMVRPIGPVVYQSPMVIAPSPGVRVVRVPSAPQVRVYVHGPRRSLPHGVWGW